MMKYTFEAKDIMPGMRVKPNSGAKEIWMVVWDASIDGDNRWGLASLKDGMVSPSRLTIPELVAHINKSDMMPVTSKESGHAD